MQVSNPNNVKIYNLSAGKSLPEWLSERKRRALQKQDVDVRRRIQLLQDFEMPTVSSCVQASQDGNYLFVTGTYKPRVRCYDLNQMSMKFERCLDADVVKLLTLSEDYTKPCFLQADRFVEFHSQGGRYYRTRLPKYGRDMAYHSPSCDMYFVGVSSEIYRLNLEQGRFLKPLVASATEISCCEFNPVHHLFACGTKEGQVECWDPRTRTRAGVLDCALSSHIEDMEVNTIPSITSLKYRDGLNLAVGTSTGHVSNVILYTDIRSDKPMLVKDHQYGLPIKSIHFQESQDLVLSNRILKIWNRHTGKAFTAVEPGTALNDLCVFHNTGLLFMANEAPKVLAYYIPGLGTAPKWCAFLDNITEELEETASSIVYDDYKFVTRRELDDLGLSHLIGSSLLRAYMHGFFMDMRLYNKAKSIADPFAYEEYRKSKIREKIEHARENRVRLKKLPRVNRMLAEKLVEQEENPGFGKKGKKEPVGSLLKDDRFSAMFQNPDFQVDTESEEYKLLNPVVSKLDKQRMKKHKLPPGGQQFEEVEGGQSDGSPDDDEDSSSNDEDERAWKAELKKQHRLLRTEKRLRRHHDDESTSQKPKFYEIKEGAEFKSLKDKSKQSKVLKKSLAERLEDEVDQSEIRQAGNSIGNKELTFSLKKPKTESRRQLLSKQHHAERRKIRRSAADISKGFKTKPKFWMGKRVK
ncbi:LOW QUALITY PROTEIN: nucleolar protein 10-like [Liolophura sinensis]|uniref:LOW QUALITY PROTEIN: nucleolar protein 10-like n=1 Tax=Liolophura sinensis TaxID=3198878 RepID=UPI0031581877